ncbi:hypothetical protein [Pyrococcus kukulkanii]|uniref:hypothetical protein n=1 Tax=Pyrococcus kukulkanii TaxID=1609559 RepID=UPI00356AD3FB
MSGDALLLLIILSPFVILGAIYMKDLILRSLGYTRVIVLNKDGTYKATWLKLNNRKEFELQGVKRVVDPRGRFIGPLGNMFIYLTESSTPITPESAGESEIDAEDVAHMTMLSFLAGKVAGMKDLQRIQMLQYIMLGVLAVNAVMLALYWQDRTKFFEALRQILTVLKP